MPTFQTVDEYLASLPEDRRGAMEALRRAVNEAAADATEAIQFPADEPIPLDLVRRVVEFRVSERTAR